MGAALKSGSLFHAESLGFDVAFKEGFLFQLTTLGGDGAFDTTVELNLTGFDVTLDVGILSDGHLPFFGDDFAVDFTVDDHVVGKSDRSGNFDPLSQHVGCVGHNVGGT